MAKSKRTVSITESVFEDLRLLTWARRQQGDFSASVSAVMDELATNYVKEHQKEIDFLKNEVAEMARRQTNLFGKGTLDE